MTNDERVATAQLVIRHSDLFRLSDFVIRHYLCAPLCRNWFGACRALLNTDEPRVTRIVHLLPSWEHVGAVRRIGLLASQLDHKAYELRAVALCSCGPGPARLSALGVLVASLSDGWRLPAAMIWPLRRTLRESRPHIVQTWNTSVCRIARLSALGLGPIRLLDDSVENIPPGIDADDWTREAAGAPRREALLASLGLPPGARPLATAGHLTADKHIVALFWALDQIRCVRDDVYLLVLGDGPARGHFERYAHLYQITDRVRFLGWRSDVAAVLSHADVYCSASQRTSCSLAMLEAMTLGLPVVAADTPAHRHLVVPGETGFLAPARQRSELARWCLRILEDDDLAARMRQAALERARTAFPLAPFAAAYKALYRAPE
jgi:glycosyltransferase involved in cell wall biosynthesis